MTSQPPHHQVRTAIVLIVFLVPAAQALTLFPEQGADAGWHLFELHSSGGGLSIPLVADMGMGVVGIDLRHMTEPRGGSFRMIFRGATSEVLVSESMGPDVETPDIYGIEIPSGLSVSNLNGSYRLAVWAAGDVNDLDFQLIPSGSTTVEHIADGSSTFFSDGSGTTSGSHAHASMDGYGLAYSDAAYTFTVEHAFYGIAGLRDGFAYPAGPNPLIERESDSEVIHSFPNGTTEECYCAPLPLREWGPGAHTIDWRGLDLHTRGDQPMLLAGVDIDIMQAE